MDTVKLRVTLTYNFYATSPLHFSMITCNVKNNNGQQYTLDGTLFIKLLCLYKL